PALVIGTQVGGIRGTAMAHALIGVFVALPLAILALHYAGVRMSAIPRRLVRPVGAAAMCALCAAAMARVVGPYPIVQLAVAGTLGLVCYAVICVPEPQRRVFLAQARARILPQSRGRRRPSAATLAPHVRDAGLATAHFGAADGVLLQNGARLENG